MGAQDLLLLAVFLYVAGAVAALIFNNSGRFANCITSLSAFAASLAGIASALLVLTGSGFRLDAPGWIPFTRFTMEVDQLSAFMVLVISFLAAAVSLYSFSYLEEYSRKNPGVLGFLINLFIASMILVVTVGNGFYFLIFWEIMTLVSYFLVIYEQDREALRAGFLYFLVAHAGAVLIMLSFILFFIITGSFDFAVFRTAKLTPVLSSVLFVLAFVGFSAKAGAVPLHFWLPEAHSVAPSNVSSLLSGVMIKTAIYGIIRVCMDFLGAGGWWWGFLVLVVGIISAVLGMVYALTQHDLKRLLAFSSIENIGIILMGVGAGMLGLALNKPLLVGLGLMAGLYHLLNHATFKGLLFLGAGSVIYRAHTRNLEELGGLAKVMPVTAFIFLVGATSIAAIPPLNGFVSKWFIYQSLFTLGMSGGFADKVFMPLFAMLLAMTGALTAMCFVKAYGVTFTGPFRSEHGEKAREAPFPMLLGKAILGLGCVVFGLGAPLIAPRIMSVVASLLNTGAVPVSAALTVFPGDVGQAALSTPLIALLLIGFLVLPLLLLVLYGGAGVGSRLDPTPWACGYKYIPQMTYSSHAFAQPLQIIFRPLYLFSATLKEFGATAGAYFSTRVAYLVQVEDMWEKFIGKPLARGVQGLGRLVQLLQLGNVRLYCTYIIITLVILLAAVRF